MSPLEAFAGLLDRSIHEISALAADARTFDVVRIGQIADMWHSNAFPLVSAASAPRWLRARRARAGLWWMADLGAARRAMMVDLDPALDGILPAAGPEQSVYRDYQKRVCPGIFPLTAEVGTALAADYDLAGASVRSLTAWPTPTGPHVDMTLAAPRRFGPSAGWVAPDGSRKPWPPAPVQLTFRDVAELRFDADDRIGVTVTCTDTGPTVVLGAAGRLRAASGIVWPDDPLWPESAAGRAADAVTPHVRTVGRKPVRTTFMSAQPWAAARALVALMVQIRLVHYYPERAATVPVLDICRIAAGAGRAILAAGARRGSARRRAFAELYDRWRQVPPDLARAPIPPGPAMLRYARYREAHADYDVARQGTSFLNARGHRAATP